MIKQVDYFLEGGSQGVLLIHGLTGTPTEMRFIAKGLQKQGFTVYAAQLAGHCGSVADLLATGWRDWSDSVAAAAEKLSARVDRMFVGGLSMGALLALNHAIEYPHDVAGLALYGVTFRHDGWSVPAIGRLSFLLPWVIPMGIGRHRVFIESYPYGLKDERMRKRVVEAMSGEDSSTAGLPGHPWPALAELFRLSRRVRARLGRVYAPTLVVHACQDDIASFRGNAEVVLQGVHAPTELLALEDSYHMVTLDGERQRVIDRSVGFFQSLARSPRPEAEDEGHFDLDTLAVE